MNYHMPREQEKVNLPSDKCKTSEILSRISPLKDGDRQLGERFPQKTDRKRSLPFEEYSALHLSSPSVRCLTVKAR